MDSQPPPHPTSDIGSSIWPRRATKACASCRRDKIRCDGADGTRPCSGCAKKGYSAEQCVVGCENCRRARTKCEDGKPCKRCCNLQLECIDEVSVSPSRQESTANANARSARMSANDRAKLACQNCRRDNKKCEDQRPCSRCVARSEECIHIGRGPKLVKLRCEGCRVDNKRCEEMRPCQQCIDQGRECVNLARKGRGHGTRVKAACTNCRRDKIRCDGIRPCASCVRKSYDCVDRACRACTRSGKEAECMHRNIRDSGAPDPSNEYTSTMQVNAQASSPDSVPLPPPPSQHMLPLPHPHMYGMPGLPIQHFYYPMPPPPNSSEHQQMGMMHHPMYPPPMLDPRAYYPVIDPNIDNPRPQGPYDHMPPNPPPNEEPNSSSNT